VKNSKSDLDVLIGCVREAGQAVFDMAKNGFKTAYKLNEDPVTTADLKADKILKETLLKHFPDTGWLSEETADELSRLNKKYVWIVDPIDGTKEFVSAIPEYALSVALAENGIPVLAAVYNPAAKQMFTAMKNAGACLNGKKIRAQHNIAEQPLILASRSEVKRGEFRQFENLAQIRPCGSIAYKLALVAAGQADATFSLGPKNEWDIAAGVLLIKEAAGKAADKSGKSFLFNRKNSLVNGIVGTTNQAYQNIRTMLNSVAGI